VSNEGAIEGNFIAHDLFNSHLSMIYNTAGAQMQSIKIINMKSV